MTKAQLEAENTAQRDMITALAAEIDALYDLFTAIRESPREAAWIVGYTGGIGSGERGKIRLLRLHAETLRVPRARCLALSGTGTQCTAPRRGHPLPHRDSNGEEWDSSGCENQAAAGRA